MDQLEFQNLLKSVEGRSVILVEHAEFIYVRRVRLLGTRVDRSGLEIRVAAQKTPGLPKVDNPWSIGCAWNDLSVGPSAWISEPNRWHLLFDPRIANRIATLVANLPAGESYLDDFHRYPAPANSRFVAVNRPGPVYAAVRDLIEEEKREHYRGVEKVTFDSSERPEVSPARRVSPPPVRIVYPVCKGAVDAKAEIPFVVGVLADLAGNSGPRSGGLLERELLDVNRENFDVCMRRIGPQVQLSVPDVIEGSGRLRVNLCFDSLDDFLPIRIARQTPVLSGMLAHQAAQVAPSSYSRQLDLILHHPALRRLEGAWRGLHFLVRSVPISDRIRIRMLPVSKDELVRESRACAGGAWDRSTLFKHFWSDVMGTRGAAPFGCLIGDFEFDHLQSDLQILQLMMRIAASCSAPFWAAASPRLLHLDSWAELGFPNDTDFQSPEYAAWCRLRDDGESRFVGLAMPRFLARAPYGAGDDRQACPGFEFEEQVTNGDPADFVWANPAYLCGILAIRAFDQSGWFANIRSFDSGGYVEGLPTYPAPLDLGTLNPRCSAEIGITERREMELSRFGLIPFMSKMNLGGMVQIGCGSIHRVPEYEDREATVHHAFSARFPYLLNISRFILTVKAMVRDCDADFGSLHDLERYLNDWLKGYVDTNPDLSTEFDRAKWPIAAGRLTLTESQEDGVVVATLECMPHYQLGGLTRPLRTRFTLPSADYLIRTRVP